MIAEKNDIVLNVEEMYLNTSELGMFERIVTESRRLVDGEDEPENIVF